MGKADVPALQDAFELDALKEMDVIVTCQGGDYTNEVYPKLREAGWKGYWIDAASTLRMADDSVIVLDPVNRNVIDQALDAGRKDFIGGNCTVSLMLMALGGLFSRGSDRVGVSHDLSGGIRRWRPEYARIADPDGHPAQECGRTA